MRHHDRARAGNWENSQAQLAAESTGQLHTEIGRLPGYHRRHPSRGNLGLAPKKDLRNRQLLFPGGTPII